MGISALKDAFIKTFEEKSPAVFFLWRRGEPENQAVCLPVSQLKPAQAPTAPSPRVSSSDWITASHMTSLGAAPSHRLLPPG